MNIYNIEVTDGSPYDIPSEFYVRASDKDEAKIIAEKYVSENKDDFMPNVEVFVYEVTPIN